MDSDFGIRHFFVIRFSSFVIILSSLTLCFAQKEPDPGPAPLDPVVAAREGPSLAADLLAALPEQNTNQGVLKIRLHKGKEREIPVHFEITRTETNWLALYEAFATNTQTQPLPKPSSNSGPAKDIQPVRTQLTVVHTAARPNRYELVQTWQTGQPTTNILTGDQAMIPFAGSDFWIADLGLEFLHWPQQRMLKSEVRLHRGCYVLESTPSQTNSCPYSRVVCSIDKESGGILHADAYDAAGEIFKRFEPTHFQKVKGQWQLEEMAIRNHKTGSLSKIEFRVTGSH